MPTPHDTPLPSPSPTATVLRTTTHATKLVALGIVLTALGLLILAGGVAMLAGAGGGGAKGIVGVVMGLVVLFFGVLPLVTAGKSRTLRVSLDATGFWLDNGKDRGVIRWDSLAGVGIHWSELGRTAKIYSLEFFPAGPIDPDDPALWHLVRDEEPLSPDLPRLRYRFPFAPDAREELTAAVREYAPQLWLGETQRAPGHLGTPDRKGHARRTGGRTA
ncbi:hypothetical protein [Streptomyces sp. NPDC050738]|uniref:hypothetical protein n=1 Tax=Streptomyces sp. NPDC050738 TaxID=3154744 RepID=UPI00341B56A0